MNHVRWLPLVAALGWPSAALAGENPPAAGTLPSGLAIVPFAVPVAVPVAVVARPTVFYSYRSLGAAAGPAASVDPSAAATVSLPPAASPAPGAAALPAEGVNTARSGDDPWRGAAAEVLTRRCAACHRGVNNPTDAGHAADPAAAARPALFDAAGVLAPRLPRRRIVEAVEPRADGPPRMPPAGEPPLAPEELRVLRSWAEVPRDLAW